MANYTSSHTGSVIDNVVQNALLKTEAASIYLTKTNATSLYPLRDGTGATGTWGINISGNAANAVKDSLGHTISSYYTPLSLFTNQGSYSTSEVNTGYTWVDGKPIYKKTFTGTSTSGTYNVNISSCNIAWPIHVEVMIQNTTNSSFVFGSYIQDGTSDKFNNWITPDKGTLQFRSGTGYAFGKFYATIWYTKNT